MDQLKIGRFIAERRKVVNLTQSQLAEKLNITDRAISKWENGKAMPDSSIMLELCDILQISVNDLLKGEIIMTENYHKELENNLFEMVKQKEQADKRLLRIEILTGVLCLIPLLLSVILVSIVPMEEWIATLISCISLIPLLIATPFMIRIEQVAGYYECGKCGHKHVPKYISVFGSMHLHTTRFLKCPKCGKRSWQKKVLNK